METHFLESQRLYFRKIKPDDFDIIASMLKDPQVMYAWEYNFTDKDVNDWITINLERYKTYGLGYFIISDKFLKQPLGQAALMPDIINNKLYYEIGYILKKEFWGKGYATEAANTLLDYAKIKYPNQEYILEIRPENLNSVKVANRLGAKITGEFNKLVHGKIMKHLIYTLD